MAKDVSDNSTMELPFQVKPLQALLNVVTQRQYTPASEAIFVQKVEARGRRESDLEMLIAVREWKKHWEQFPAPDRRRYIFRAVLGPAYGCDEGII